MNTSTKKRNVDFQFIAEWVKEEDRILDLGCGRGVLLEYLKQTKSAYAVGVDIEFEKVLSCIKRGVIAYHGDVKRILARFETNSFDRVILSRSVDLINQPDARTNPTKKIHEHDLKVRNCCVLAKSKLLIHRFR